MTDLAASGALPKPKRDILPVLLPAIVALAMLPLIGSGSSWVTLTVASLAMGMMIFIMASGLTLVFVLMDVLNFGHGAFIAVGAYVATLVLLPLASWVVVLNRRDQSGPRSHQITNNMFHGCKSG
jgi:branched-chain amino acid transport system permease protein